MNLIKLSRFVAVFAFGITTSDVYGSHHFNSDDLIDFARFFSPFKAPSQESSGPYCPLYSSPTWVYTMTDAQVYAMVDAQVREQISRAHAIAHPPGPLDVICIAGISMFKSSTPSRLVRNLEQLAAEEAATERLAQTPNVLSQMNDASPVIKYTREELKRIGADGVIAHLDGEITQSSSRLSFLRVRQAIEQLKPQPKPKKHGQYYYKKKKGANKQRRPKVDVSSKKKPQKRGFVPQTLSQNAFPGGGAQSAPEIVLPEKLNKKVFSKPQRGI